MQVAQANRRFAAVALALTIQILSGFDSLGALALIVVPATSVCHA